MTWDYEYTAQAPGNANGPEPLSDYMTGVRVITEYGLSGMSDPGYRQPGQHGTVWQAGGLYGPGQVLLAGVLRDTDSTGAVTHVDGRSGHIYENLSAVKRLLARVDGLSIITRTAPHQGAVRLRTMPGSGPWTTGQNRFDLRIPLVAPWPFWEGAQIGPVALTTGFTPTGDAPLSNMVVTFAGAGSVVNQIDGSGFEVLGACTVTHGSASARSVSAPANFLPRDDRWLHLHCGDENTLTVSGGPTITYRPQWR